MIAAQIKSAMTKATTMILRNRLAIAICAATRATTQKKANPTKIIAERSPIIVRVLISIMNQYGMGSYPALSAFPPIAWTPQVAELGFEPRLEDSESPDLPLVYSAMEGRAGYEPIHSPRVPLCFDTERTS